MNTRKVAAGLHRLPAADIRMEDRLAGFDSPVEVVGILEAADRLAVVGVGTSVVVAAEQHKQGAENI